MWANSGFHDKQSGRSKYDFYLFEFVDNWYLFIHPKILKYYNLYVPHLAESARSLIVENTNVISQGINALTKCICKLCFCWKFAPPFKRILIIFWANVTWFLGSYRKMKTNDINHGLLDRCSIKLVCILDVNRILKGRIQRCL